MSELSANHNAQTPEQKREIIERLYQIWIQHPQQRLGQLVSISGRYYRSDYNLIEEIEWQYKHDRHSGQEIQA